jgi:hypothetical protein
MSEQPISQASDELPGEPIHKDFYSTELRLHDDGKQSVEYYDADSDSRQTLALDQGEELIMVAGDNGKPREPFIRKMNRQGQATDTHLSSYVLAKQAPRQEHGTAMPETFRKNIRTLESRGELGVWFAGLYKAAVDEYPGLDDIEIRPGGSTDYRHLASTGGFATHKSLTESGRYNITVNTDDGMAHYDNLLAKRRASAEASAGKLGIKPGEITSRQLSAFIFLHELGHIVDYMENAPDQATHEARRARDKGALPVANYNPVQLMSFLKSEAGRKWFNDPNVKQYYGVDGPAELLAKQEAAYHSMETEDIPDRFAAKVMRKNNIV